MELPHDAKQFASSGLSQVDKMFSISSEELLPFIKARTFF